MMYTMHRMKAGRSPLATALVVVVVMLTGCGPFFGPEAGPGAPSFDPPSGTYNEQVLVTISSSEGQLYITTDPTLNYLEYDRFNGGPIPVGDDLIIQAYCIDDRSLRSPISRAEYIIDSTDIANTVAPTISSPGLWQSSADYFWFDIGWDAWPPVDTNDSNPSDDLTDWYNLEFAVYASPANNIDTLGDAQTNGTIVKDWHSANTSASVGSARYSASAAGERRYVNVFVRDQEGNASAYGSVRMESSLGPPDIITGAQTWLNPQDGSLDPVFSGVGTPPADVVTTHVVALIDMDDDGLDDLVACYDDSVPVTHQAWFSSLGNGSFAPTPHYFDQNSEIATDLEIADLNQDGVPEIIFSNSSSIVTYSEAGAAPMVAIALAGVDVFAVGDIDGDGYPDIVTGDAAAAAGFEVIVWINEGDGSFAAVVQVWAGQNPNPVDVVLADLDRDGFADLVVANSNAIPVAPQIYYGTDDGTLVEGPMESWSFVDRSSPP